MDVGRRINESHYRFCFGYKHVVSNRGEGRVGEVVTSAIAGQNEGDQYTPHCVCVAEVTSAESDLVAGQTEIKRTGPSTLI